MKKLARALWVPLFASVMLATAACTSTAKHENAAQYADDTYITSKVKGAILGEPNLKSAEINVETYKGVVQLSGFVSTSEMAMRAVEVARAVGSVKSVRNDMVIK